MSGDDNTEIQRIGGRNFEASAAQDQRGSEVIGRTRIASKKIAFITLGEYVRGCVDHSAILFHS